MKSFTQKAQFDMVIAGISIRMEAPFPMELPWDLQAFIVDTPVEPQVTYQIQVLDQPLSLPKCAAFRESQLEIYPMADGWLRVFPYLFDDTGCQAALYLRYNGHHTLYLPAGDLERYHVKGVLSPILGLEWVLLQHDCLILHSSVVTYRDHAILFCGASGVGKSTQAALWEKYLGAEIINGDRCAIVQRKSGFYGCGSPFSGSSEIYLAKEAPIRAILFLNQADQNVLSPAAARYSFTQLYAQTVQNTWDPGYTQKLCDLFEQIIANIPFYHLSCLPDQSAVALVRDTLFPDEGA